MDDNNKNFINILNAFSDSCLFQNQNTVELDEKKIYLCKFPPKSGIPIFDFFKIESKFKLRLSCLCKKEEELSFEEAFKKYVDNYQEKVDYTDYFECKEPGHGNNRFEYYCPICKLNLCSLCFQKFRICPHTDREIFSLNQRFEDYKEDGLNIKNRLNNYNNIDPYMKKLYDVIYDNFIEFKNNYSYFDIIKKYNELISNNNFN